MPPSAAAPAIERHPGRTGLLGLFALALLLRLLYLAQASSDPLLYVPFTDEEYYVDFGQRIAAGDWAGGPGVFFMDPLYGYFLGLCFWLFGDNLTFPRLVQMLLDAGSAPLLAWIGARLWGRPAGITAGVVYAAYPVAWYYTLALLKTTLATSLLLWVCVLTLRALERPQPLRWLGLGLLIALAVYQRSYLLLLAPMVLALLGLEVWRAGIAWRRPLLALLLGAGVVFGAVGTRNLLVGGEFHILTGQAGSLFYSVNHPDNPQGLFYEPAFITNDHPARLEGEFRAEAERRTGRTLNVSEASSYWMSQAIDYLLSSPEIVPRLVLAKLRNLLTHAEIPNNQSFELAAGFAPMLMPQVPYFAILFALGLPGLMLAALGDRRVLALWMAVVVVLATGLLFYSASRFRFPMVPVLALGAGYVLASGWWRGRPAWATGLVGALSLGLFSLSLSLQNPYPVTATARLQVHRAIAYGRLGQFREAEGLFQGLAPLIGETRKFQGARGYVALLGHDYAGAERWTRLALASVPNDGALLANLGLALRGQGRMDEAFATLERAWRVAGDAEIAFWMAEIREDQDDRAGALGLYRTALRDAAPGAGFVPKARLAAERLGGG